MVEEFDFYRKVRTYYCNVTFQVSFTYRVGYRKQAAVTAEGTFSCGVNAHTQTVEYIMQLKSDSIERPRSESGTFLFNKIYEEIPPQTIEFKDYSIYKQRYRVPISYDWQHFIMDGAENGINVNTMQALFKKWKIVGTEGQEVDAGLKVNRVQLNW